MSRRSTAALLVLLLVPACSTPADPTGSEGAVCTAEGSCQVGLICLGGLCVKPRDSGWLDAFKPLGDRPAPVDGPAADAPLPDGSLDRPRPAADLPRPQADLPKPKPDLTSPSTCKLWSSYACTANPSYGVACWATCQSRTIWCSYAGVCTCLIGGAGGACASGMAVSSSSPCATCQAALETRSCCLP